MVRPALLFLTSLLVLGGCRLGPPLCLRTPGGGQAFTVGSAAELSPGTLDLLGECDRPAPPDVSWSSSAPDVATVSAAGVVHALSPGDVEVTARSGPATATWEVTVFPVIDRIDIEPQNAVMTVGDTLVYWARAYGVGGVPLPNAPVTIFPRSSPPVSDSTGRWNWDAWVVYPVYSPFRMRRAEGRTESWRNVAALHAKRPGSTQVTVSVYGFRDSTTITVVSP